MFIRANNFLRWTYFGPTRFIHPWTTLVHATLRVSDVIEKCNNWSADVTLDLTRLLNHKIEPRHDKTNKMNVRPAKTQISLGICPVLSESSLCAQWVVKDPRFLHADSEDSDQTGRMPRLIWVFAGRALILLVLSCRGSNIFHRPSFKRKPVQRLKCVLLRRKLDLRFSHKYVSYLFLLKIKCIS